MNSGTTQVNVAQTGDLSKDELFQSIGHTFAEWAQVENQLVTVFSVCVAGSTFAQKEFLSRDVAIAAYDLVETAETRLRMIDRAVLKMLKICAKLAAERGDNRLESRTEQAASSYRIIAAEADGLRLRLAEIHRGGVHQLGGTTFVWEPLRRIFDAEPPDGPSYSLNADQINSIAQQCSVLAGKLESLVTMLHEVRVAETMKVRTGRSP